MKFVYASSHKTSGISIGVNSQNWSSNSKEVNIFIDFANGETFHFSVDMRIPNNLLIKHVQDMEEKTIIVENMKPIYLPKNLSITFYPNIHVPGAISVVITANYMEEKKTILIADNCMHLNDIAYMSSYIPQSVIDTVDVIIMDLSDLDPQEIFNKDMINNYIFQDKTVIILAHEHLVDGTLSRVISLLPGDSASIYDDEIVIRSLPLKIHQNCC